MDARLEEARCKDQNMNSVGFTDLSEVRINVFVEPDDLQFQFRLLNGDPL